MGSGGGRSGMFPQPAYQHGVVPDNLATAGGTGPARRVVPDVSADAGAFWLIGYTEEAADGGYGETYGGGTSGSSPILAALEADAKQATGHALGFVNPALYNLAGTRAVHDVLPVDPRHPPLTVESNYLDEGPGLYLDVLAGTDGTLRTTPGYDEVTGIGSPGRGFVTAFHEAR